jgi:hypothetical protein
MQKLGTVNGYSVSPARLGRKAFEFDGTVKGLTLAALAVGAKAGDKVQANFGGGFRDYRIHATPWDARANGFWAERDRA